VTLLQLLKVASDTRADIRKQIKHGQDMIQNVLLAIQARYSELSSPDQRREFERQVSNLVDDIYTYMDRLGAGQRRSKSDEPWGTSFDKCKEIVLTLDQIGNIMLEQPPTLDACRQLLRDTLEIVAKLGKRLEIYNFVQITHAVNRAETLTRIKGEDEGIKHLAASTVFSDSPLSPAAAAGGAAAMTRSKSDVDQLVSLYQPVEDGDPDVFVNAVSSGMSPEDRVALFRLARAKAAYSKQ
jgi:hypothetical protein